MLSSSLRRATRAPAVPIPGLSRSSSQALAASSNVRRRGYSSSSSKPSDGSRKVDASSQAPAKTSRRRGKDGNGRNGSSKHSQDTAFSNLPSVPSTQHRQPHDIHVASFFSLHRPISVSTSVPPTSTPETFDAIFSKNNRKPAQQEVMNTLSSAVDSMENSAAHQAEQDDSPQFMLRAGGSGSGGGGGGAMNHFDSEGSQFDAMNMSDMKVSVEDMARQFQPFRPPPVPVPFDESKTTAPQGTENLSESSSSTDMHKPSSSYSTVLTIHESTHPDGRVTFDAHTTPFVRNDMEAPGASEHAITDPQSAPTTYMERLRRNRSMQTMSTKRRRRFKMKKHKWKKRLRATRSIRQKLDKT